MVDAEVVDTGKKALIEELEELKSSLSKLAVTQAKSAGWETRLQASEQDRDDLRQELDAERQRSKTAEAQVNSLKERCGKSFTVFVIYISLTSAIREVADGHESRPGGNESPEALPYRTFGGDLA